MSVPDNSNKVQGVLLLSVSAFNFNAEKSAQAWHGSTALRCRWMVVPKVVVGHPSPPNPCPNASCLLLCAYVSVLYK
eukprot:6262362-Amphidinium_carterae.1